jgi:hypothetical protein
MRVVIAALLLASAAACNRQVETAVDEAWQSNRELTLAELELSGGFSEDEWRALSDPTLFGHMIHIYRGSVGVTVFEGQCSPENAFEIVSATDSSTEVRYFDDFYDEERTVLLTTDGDRLYVPMKLAKGQFRETFSRISAETVVRRHPCTRGFIAGMR